jgi:hypothetical protein
MEVLMVTLFGKRMRLFRPRTIWIRKLVQWFFFLLIALIAVNHTLAASGAAIPVLSSASLHAVCPSAAWRRSTPSFPKAAGQ